MTPYLTVKLTILYFHISLKKRCAIKSGKLLLQPQRPLAASKPLWDLGRYVTKDGVVPKMYRLISRLCNRTRRPQNFFGNFQTIQGRLIFEPLKHYHFMTICSCWSLNNSLALQMRIWSECGIKFSTYIPKYRRMANFNAHKFRRTVGV